MLMNVIVFNFQLFSLLIIIVVVTEKKAGVNKKIKETEFLNQVAMQHLIQVCSCVEMND